MNPKSNFNHRHSHLPAAHPELKKRKRQAKLSLATVVLDLRVQQMIFARLPSLEHSSLPNTTHPNSSRPATAAAVHKSSLPARLACCKSRASRRAGPARRCKRQDPLGRAGVGGGGGRRRFRIWIRSLWFRCWERRGRVCWRWWLVGSMR